MYAAIRIRGNVNLSPQIRKTLELLNLHKGNHMVLVPSEQHGMLKKVRAYITFGEIDEKTLAITLQKRARIEGNKKLEEEFLKQNKFKNFEDMAKALLEKTATLAKLGVKPVFRLTPPKKGHERKGIKKDYTVGGALGYRASDINKLLLKMI